MKIAHLEEWTGTSPLVKIIDMEGKVAVQRVQKEDINYFGKKTNYKEYGEIMIVSSDSLENIEEVQE